MADARKSVLKVIGGGGGGKEGIHDNDPKDPGGETVFGIARNYDADWVGWKLVDQRKLEPNFPKNLDTEDVLNLALDYYVAKYASKVRASEIPDQVIADELVDTGINIGWTFTIYFLKICLNDLNREGKLYPNLPLDGNFDTTTLNALVRVLQEKGSTKVLWKALNICQGFYYLCGGKDNFKAIIEILRNNPPPEWRESFMWGWLTNRAFEAEVAEALFGK